MIRLFKILFFINSILSLFTGIQVWITKEPTSLMEIVIDNFTLAIFFFILGISTIPRVKEDE